MTTRRIVIPELEAAPAQPRQYWSQQDKMVVAAYYGVKETDALARYLDRSLASIQFMARVLGISFSSTEEDRDTVTGRIEAGEL